MTVSSAAVLHHLTDMLFVSLYFYKALHLNSEPYVLVVHSLCVAECAYHFYILTQIFVVCDDLIATLLSLLVLQMDKRESVLSMALEHGLVGFITACISQWSTAGDAFNNVITTMYTSVVYLFSCIT